MHQFPFLGRKIKKNNGAVSIAGSSSKRRDPSTVLENHVPGIKQKTSMSNTWKSFFEVAWCSFCSNERLPKVLLSPVVPDSPTATTKQTSGESEMPPLFRIKLKRKPAPTFKTTIDLKSKITPTAHTEHRRIRCSTTWRKNKNNAFVQLMIVLNYGCAVEQKQTRVHYLAWNTNFYQSNCTCEMDPV